MKIFLCLFLTTTLLCAQNTQDTLQQPKVQVNTTTLSSVDKSALDKINGNWIEHLYKSSPIDTIFTQLESSTENNWEFKELSTETLKLRLERLNEKTPFNIEYNPELERIIKSYLKYRSRYYPELMARADFYFPFFEEQLANSEIPLEIKYLSIVESALKPKAKSGVGATGLWQFMYATGKSYGLKVSSYVDERQDPYKSTKAACAFLKDLYGIFNDWDLALAAYNSGPGNVSKAIRRSGGKTNYWNIRPFLPRETASYLPAFYATLYIFEYAKEHGIEKEPPKIHHYEIDSIEVKQLISFEQIHHMVGTDIDLLEHLNPAYKLNMIPYIKDKKYKLVLPIKDAIKFVDKEHEIYTYISAEDKKRERPLPKYFEMSKRIRYSVRSGDFLGSIANKFGVRVKDIKKWNGLRSDNLKIGQRLSIYPKKLNYTVAKPSKKKVEKVEVPKKGTKKIHTIAEGDNLWDIARKYDVTVVALKSWNNLWDTNNLKLGKKLVIYKM